MNINGFRFHCQFCGRGFDVPSMKKQHEQSCKLQTREEKTDERADR